MKRALCCLSAWFSLIVGLAGCQPAGAADRADITGEVRLVGNVPDPSAIDRSSEPACEIGTAYVETVLSWDGKLANVHVSIESATMGKHKTPKTPVIVQQSDCLYVPRVQGVMRGQQVLVTNGDPTVHNVHAKANGETLSNKMQPVRSDAFSIDTKQAGEVLRLGCDVHSWMRAYLPVTDHPYFDISGEDGSFRIRNVPSGKTVTIRAWHERYGVLTKKASAGQSVTFSFSDI